MKENSINNWEGVTRKYTNNQIPKKPNNFGLKYGNQKKTRRKGWMDKQYYKRTRRTRSRLQSGNTHRFTQNDTKKNTKLENARPWWNTWFPVQEFNLYSRHTSTRNEQMLTRSTDTRLDDQRKDHTDPKVPKQINFSKQLQTDNLPTNDVENTNRTNKRKDLLLTNKPQIVPQRTERMPQRIQRHSRTTLHRSTNPKWEQDQTEKSSYGLYRLQKDIWCAFTKLDNKLPQSVQNITWSHQLYRKNHEDLESGNDDKRKKLSWNKDPKRYFLRRCTITVTIHNSHDAT